MCIRTRQETDVRYMKQAQIDAIAVQGNELTHVEPLRKTRSPCVIEDNLNLLKDMTLLFLQKIFENEAVLTLPNKCRLDENKRLK